MMEMTPQEQALFDQERVEIQARLTAMAQRIRELRAECDDEACEGLADQLDRFVYDVAPRVMNMASEGDREAHMRLFRALDNLEGIPAEAAAAERAELWENLKQTASDVADDVQVAGAAVAGTVAAGGLIYLVIVALTLYIAAKEK